VAGLLVTGAHLISRRFARGEGRKKERGCVREMKESNDSTQFGSQQLADVNQQQFVPIAADVKQRRARRRRREEEEEEETRGAASLPHGRINEYLLSFVSLPRCEIISKAQRRCDIVVERE
jgi:hypothetical protein